VRAAVHEAFAEKPEPAADVKRAESGEVFIAEELVDEDFETAVRVVWGESAGELVAEAFVAEFLFGDGAHGKWSGEKWHCFRRPRRPVMFARTSRRKQWHAFWAAAEGGQRSVRQRWPAL
jgi:hypothetical protein